MLCSMSRLTGRIGAYHAFVLAMVGIPVLLVGSCRADTPPQATDPVDMVSLMREDIALLAMINRLSLSQEQATQLMELARRAQAARAGFDAPRHAAMQKLLPLLEQQMSRLIHDQQVPGELRDQIEQAEAELQAVDARRQEAPLSFAAEARELLAEPQLLILTGGDEAFRAAEEMLIWIRELSDADFPGEGHANADALSDPEIGLDADAIYAIFSQARALTPDEYLEGIGPLAGKLAPLYAAGEQTEAMIVADLLVHPRFLPLMQRRLQYLTAGGGDG